MIRRIALLVDGNKCFDMLHQTGGDLTNVAYRLSVPFLTGEKPSFLDAVGLEVYGISIDSIEPVADATVQPGETPEAVLPAVPATLNEWFMTLPPERQKMLREDKWMLAEAAWKAASERTAT